MNEKNLKYLKEQAQALGFPDRIAEQISNNISANKQAFPIYYSNQIKDDELMYDMYFLKGLTVIII